MIDILFPINVLTYSSAISELNELKLLEVSFSVVESGSDLGHFQLWKVTTDDV